MPYTNCAACGAKALVGATRCPRCQAPFVSYDIGGERVPTVNCPNCGVQRPVAIGVCPNCLMSTAPSGRRLARGLILTGLAMAAILTVGYVMSRGTEQTRSDPVSAVSAPDTALVVTTPPDSTVLAASDIPDRALSTAAAPAAPSAPAASRVESPADAAKITSPSPAVQRPAPLPNVAVPDTGRWEYATANTWVRVRSAPTRESDVLRMVDSAQRVRLGPPMNGWRPIRVGVDRGWVDPRLFTVLPAARP